MPRSLTDDAEVRVRATAPPALWEATVRGYDDGTGMWRVTIDSQSRTAVRYARLGLPDATPAELMAAGVMETDQGQLVIVALWDA